MPSLNQVSIIGNLAADPEVRTIPSGAVVANFRVGVNESFKDTAGAKQQRTEWFSVVLWNRNAEVARDYLKKGAQVFIQGSQRTESWDDNGVTKYRVKLNGYKLVMLSRPNGQGNASEAPASQPAATAPVAKPAAAAPAAASHAPASEPPVEEPGMDLDDIPF